MGTTSTITWKHSEDMCHSFMNHKLLPVCRKVVIQDFQKIRKRSPDFLGEKLEET